MTKQNHTQIFSLNQLSGINLIILKMKLKTHICKKVSALDTNKSEYRRFQNSGKKTSISSNKDVEKSNVVISAQISCIDWSSNEEVYFVSDDHQIFKMNSMTHETTEVAKLPDDFTPTDLHWLLLGGRSSGGGKGSDTLLISSTDGRFIILNKSARVERNISAHAAAITSARWSPDAAGLLTASEDGIIKIWSRSGMLRSTVIQSNEPIRCARWAPQSTSIIFCQGAHISIKPLAANSKLIRWRAHDGGVLTLSVSSHSNIIASGGEDFRFKLWDMQGANLFTSATEEYAITALAFNAEKDVLLVGSFNMLKICSSAGWSHSSLRFSDPIVGSFYALSWSSDGTQVACGTITGNIIIGYIVDEEISSYNMKAKTTGKKSISLQDIANGTSDELEFPERVINFCLGYGYLIVATTNQLQIYNQKYLNTPIIIDGRSDVKHIQIGKKYFMVLDATSIWIYNFMGRLHSNPRYTNSQAQVPLLTAKGLSLGLDVLVIRDTTDTTVLHIFDLVPGASRQFDPHALRVKTQIFAVAACRAGTLEDQFAVFIDVNRELYITETRNINGASGATGGINAGRRGVAGDEVYKIGTQVTDVIWASETNILVAIHDTCFSVYYCPGEGAADPTIIALTTVTIDTAEFGKNIAIESFENSIVSFRCAGSLLSINVNIYCEMLHRTLMEGHWQQALKICRMAKNANLWSTLAAMAIRKNHLQISEEAYAAALQIDKVSYLQHIKNLAASSPEQLSEVSLIFGHIVEAETILLHNKKYKEVIELCLRMNNWQRALEITQKNQTDCLEKLLSERKKYLKALGRNEWEALYLPFHDNDNENDMNEK